MPFTNLDKALCDRLARGLHSQARTLLTIHGSNWQASKEARRAKLEFDRLERDARDASLLAKRMVGEEKQRKVALTSEKDDGRRWIDVNDKKPPEGVRVAVMGDEADILNEKNVIVDCGCWAGGQWSLETQTMIVRSWSVIRNG